MKRISSILTLLILSLTWPNAQVIAVSDFNYNEVANLLVHTDLIENDNGDLRMSVRAKKYLFIEGTINQDTPEDFERILDAHPAITTVVLTNVPGSSDDEANILTGLLIREIGLNTFLPNRGFVSSGGTDLFLSGKRRFFQQGAKIGVHSWAYEDDQGRLVPGRDVPKDDDIHELYLDYYQTMGIPEDFYWFTLTQADIDSIHWMNLEQMHRYGLFTDLI